MARDREAASVLLAAILIAGATRPEARPSAAAPEEGAEAASKEAARSEGEKTAAEAAALRPLLWEPHPRVDRLDLRHGAGGPGLRPRPPFTFLEEDDSGTQPKVKVRDGRGRVWSVKWGEESRAETFAARVVWAAGYHATPTHFVRRGRLREVGELGRAREHVAADGSFRDARFQLRDPHLRLVEEEHSWAWHDNPFVGTSELDGLKILVMLLSNWDEKDARDTDLGSNTGIFLDERRPGVARYAVLDWGATMGRWGSALEHTVWDCEGYADQTDSLVRDRRGELVEWAFRGKHTTSTVVNVDVDDVRWLLARLAPLGDRQVRQALAASGAGSAERDCFARAFRARLDRLRRLVRDRDAGADDRD